MGPSCCACMKGRAFAAVVLSALLLLSGLGIGGWWLLWQRGPLQLAHHPLTLPRAARFVPASASFSLYLFSDGQRPVDYARAVAPARQRRPAGEAIARLRDGAFAAAGLDYQDELAGWLGGDIAMALFEDPVAAAGAAEQPSQGWLLALASRDDDGARRFLQRFWQTRSLAGTDLQVSRYRGMGLISGRGALLGSRPEPLATALVDDDLVLIASGRNLLERALDVSQIPELNQAGQPLLRQGVAAFGSGAALAVATPQALQSWLGLPAEAVAGNPATPLALSDAAMASRRLPRMAALAAALPEPAAAAETSVPVPSDSDAGAAPPSSPSAAGDPAATAAEASPAPLPGRAAPAAESPQAGDSDPLAASAVPEAAPSAGRPRPEDGPRRLPRSAEPGDSQRSVAAPSPSPAPAAAAPAPAAAPLASPPSRATSSSQPAAGSAPVAERGSAAPVGSASEAAPTPPRAPAATPAAPATTPPPPQSPAAPARLNPAGAPALLAVLQPQGRQLELRARLLLPGAPQLQAVRPELAEALLDSLRGSPSSLALIQDPAAVGRQPLLRPLLERSLGLRPQPLAERQGPLPALLARSIQGPLLVSQAPEGWQLASRAGDPAAAELEPLLAQAGLLEAPLAFEGHSLRVWTHLAPPARSGRRERGAPDALVAPLVGWSESRQDLAWWGQTLAALEAPAESRPLTALRRGLRELGVPQAPVQWSLDADGARALLRSWQPWRLLSALAGGGLDGPVRGLAMAVESPPEFNGLELRARLSLGA